MHRVGQRDFYNLSLNYTLLTFNTTYSISSVAWRRWTSETLKCEFLKVMFFKMRNTLVKITWVTKNLRQITFRTLGAVSLINKGHISCPHSLIPLLLFLCYVLYTAYISDFLWVFVYFFVYRLILCTSPPREIPYMRKPPWQ